MVEFFVSLGDINPGKNSPTKFGISISENLVSCFHSVLQNLSRFFDYVIRIFAADAFYERKAIERSELTPLLLSHSASILRASVESKIQNLIREVFSPNTRESRKLLLNKGFSLKSDTSKKYLSPINGMKVEY